MSRIGRPQRPAVRADADWYVTDPDYPSALINGWAQRDRQPPGPLWDGACGDGALIEVFRDAGYVTIASDLHDRGYGQSGVDFLTTTTPAGPSVVMNPPWKDDLPERFARHAIDVLRVRECWLLCEVTWLGAIKRFDWFRSAPLAHIWIVGSRQPMWPNGERPRDKRDRRKIPCCWFGFVQDEGSRRQVDFLLP